MRLLIADDELSMRELLDIVFKEEGFYTVTASSLAEAIESFSSNTFDIVISDLKLGDGSGLELLKIVKNKDKNIPFILITAYASAESAIDALKTGAFDYITKPFDINDLKKIVQNALKRPIVESSQTVIEKIEPTPKIIGSSPEMINIYKTIGVIAKSDSTVLLTGESGTGKEMIARVIHESSPRKDFHFVTINCGAFPETLLESELFGYQRGAFTGAVTNKKGLFEIANNGTLFLDEIAETSLSMQVKLLRAIQEKKIRRLGGLDEISINVRIIAATNKDLQQLIKTGAFREDLYYRIAVIPIHLPPLRDRREDIPSLAQYFLKKFSKKSGKNIKGFSKPTMKALLSYDWKGNVRELENVVERAILLETTEEIQPERLPVEIIHKKSGLTSGLVSLPSITEEGVNLDEVLEQIERSLIMNALKICGGVQIEAARLLHISYRSLRHRMQKFGIST